MVPLQHHPSSVEAACIPEGKARVSSGLLCTDWARSGSLGTERSTELEPLDSGWWSGKHLGDCCGTALTLKADFCTSLLLIPKRCWWKENFTHRQLRFEVRHRRSWGGRAEVEPHAPVLGNRPVAFRIFFLLEPGTVPAHQQEPAGLHSAG